MTQRKYEVNDDSAADEKGQRGIAKKGKRVDVSKEKKAIIKMKKIM